MMRLGGILKPQDPKLFKNSLEVSLAVHACFWLAAWGLLRRFSFIPPAPVEIDLTQPPGTGPAKLGAPKRSSPRARPGPKETEPTIPAPPKPQEATQPPKDWVLPGPQTKAVETPAPPPPTPGGAPEGTGTASKVGGWGVGSDDGVPGGAGTGGGGSVLKPPRLLNRDEVLANIRRFYPENERLAGHEATVVAALHIGADGIVSGTDIMDSGGTAFDEASRKVARIMRFSPAETAGGPVAVKIRQPMVFRLQD